MKWQKKENPPTMPTLVLAIEILTTTNQNPDAKTGENPQIGMSQEKDPSFMDTQKLTRG